MVHQLTRNLEDFNRTAKIFMKRIQHDMKMTKKKLSESEWLEGFNCDFSFDFIVS